jgi:hypothetical protein
MTRVSSACGVFEMDGLRLSIVLSVLTLRSGFPPLDRCVAWQSCHRPGPAIDAKPEQGAYSHFAFDHPKKTRPDLPCPLPRRTQADQLSGAAMGPYSTSSRERSCGWQELANYSGRRSRLLAPSGGRSNFRFGREADPNEAVTRLPQSADPRCAARSGEGPFTIRFADLRHRAMQTGGLVNWRSTP